MNIRFVTATEEDIPIIFEQAKHLIDTYEDIRSIDYGRVLKWVERKISHQISQYRCVVVDNRKCAYWHLSTDGELDDLYVLPGFQSMGIGTLILETCIRESKEPLWLYVFSRNTRAISFYERFGFSVRERVGDTRIIMERKD